MRVSAQIPMAARALPTFLGRPGAWRTGSLSSNKKEARQSPAGTSLLA